MKLIGWLIFSLHLHKLCWYGLVLTKIEEKIIFSIRIRKNVSMILLAWLKSYLKSRWVKNKLNKVIETGNWVDILLLLLYASLGQRRLKSEISFFFGSCWVVNIRCLSIFSFALLIILLSLPLSTNHKFPWFASTCIIL